MGLETHIDLMLMKNTFYLFLSVKYGRTILPLVSWSKVTSFIAFVLNEAFSNFIY